MTSLEFLKISAILAKISNDLDPGIINSITQTDMYNKTYMYTLNRYRNLIITEAQKHPIINIEPKHVDLYLLNMMKTHYFPELQKTCKRI